MLADRFWFMCDPKTGSHERQYILAMSEVLEQNLREWGRGAQFVSNDLKFLEERRRERERTRARGEEQADVFWTNKIEQDVFNKG